MNFDIIKRLPTTEEIIQKFPISQQGHAQIERDKQEVKDILAGRDSRILMIVGPCSAWPLDPVLAYAEKLKALDVKIRDKVKIVMRVYIQKPRTMKGWTGPLTQPDPFSPPDIEQGMLYARALMTQIIEMGLPIADEALFTRDARCFMELLSWVAVGARSTEDQEHRIFASAIDCAVGMKNPTSGSIEIGANSVLVAQQPHIAVLNDCQVQTSGNPFAHLVLRGGVAATNYAADDLYRAQDLLEKHRIAHPAVVVDASHDNCRVDGVKNPLQQVVVVREVLDTLRKHPDLRPLVKGFMVESFLKSGSQKIEGMSAEEVDRDGLSVTDPCLSWEATEELLLSVASELPL